MRTTRDHITRPHRIRTYKQYFLIVCEDKNTEPAYFNGFAQAFPPDTLYLRAVGTGRDPLGVVQKAITYKQELQYEAKREIDFVWVVFDKDDADINTSKRVRFEKALKIAKEEKMHIAYSNEVFELWLLLHFMDLPAEEPIPRKWIYGQLQEEVRKFGGRFARYNYVHGNVRILDMVDKLGIEEKAVDRAKQLLIYHKGKPVIEANPSTRVHVLVEELREWIRFYHWSPP
ncbi:RloB family protein [Algivirga pacifica]|uniref:RloB family protein n=1 Tax=Algivirga pacifica TaxID=1162670 RepID=UPI0031ED1E00